MALTDLLIHQQEHLILTSLFEGQIILCTKSFYKKTKLHGVSNSCLINAHALSIKCTKLTLKVISRPAYYLSLQYMKMCYQKLYSLNVTILQLHE